MSNFCLFFYLKHFGETGDKIKHNTPKNIWKWPQNLQWLWKLQVLIIIIVRHVAPGARFSKFRKVFRPEKPLVKLRPAYSVKLVFSYVAKGIKIKITAKFRASKRLHFEDTNRISRPEIRPKSFGTFEKQAPE